MKNCKIHMETVIMMKNIMITKTIFKTYIGISHMNQNFRRNRF